MRIYKAFLLNEGIILKRNMKWLPLFFLLPIGFIVAPYLNRFNLSGIHYTDQLASTLALGGMLLGISMFSGIFSLSSTCFEKTEGMHYFLFTQGIHKLPYLFAKITSSVSLSMIGSFFPLFLYYGIKLYRNYVVPLPVVLSCIVAFSILWTMISMVCAQFFSRILHISFLSLGVICLLITGFVVLFLKLRFSIVRAFSLLLFVVVCLAFATFYILNLKERKLGSDSH